MKRLQVVVPVVLFLVCFAAYAYAGVVITNVDTTFDEPPKSEKSIAYISDNGMRAETRGEGENTIVIFRSDKEVFWMINASDNTYTEMTKKDIKQMKGKMDEAMAMMQEQMKNMPPEQREMMEKMMKSPAMPAQPEKTVFKKVASGIKVSKWKCDRYEGYRRGELTEEVCATSWKDLGIEHKDFQVMQSMGEFMSELSPDAASQFNVGSDEWEKDQGYPGIPVLTISYSMGQKEYQSEIQDVKREKIDPSLFELPKGLTKQNFMESME